MSNATINLVGLAGLAVVSRPSTRLVHVHRLLSQERAERRGGRIFNSIALSSDWYTVNCQRGGAFAIFNTIFYGSLLPQFREIGYIALL
jgi:hypothetical protein